MPPVNVMTFPPKYFSSPSGTEPMFSLSLAAPVAALLSCERVGSPSRGRDSNCAARREMQSASAIEWWAAAAGRGWTLWLTRVAGFGGRGHDQVTDVQQNVIRGALRETQPVDESLGTG